MDPKNLIYFNHFVWLNISSSIVPFKLIDLTNSTFLFLASFKIPYRLKKLQKSRKTILKKKIHPYASAPKCHKQHYDKSFYGSLWFLSSKFLVSYWCFFSRMSGVFVCCKLLNFIAKYFFIYWENFFFEKFSELRLKLNLHKPEKALNCRILWRSDFFLY